MKFWTPFLSFRDPISSYGHPFSRPGFTYILGDYVQIMKVRSCPEKKKVKIMIKKATYH